MFFEDYDAGLEKYCRELESSARTMTGAEEKELFGKFFGQDPEKLGAEALSARDQIISANMDLAVAMATKFAHSREMPKDELVSEATFALVMAGWTSPLTVIAGASPQAPRHETVSTVNSRSSVVFLPSVRPRSLRRVSRIA